MTRLPCLLGLVAVLFSAALPASSLDWPVVRKIVTGTFGEDRGDHFHAGIDIGGGAQDVHPVHPGELLVRHEDGASYTTLPRGTGSFVALLHAQDIVTVYCHLDTASLGPRATRYATTDRIGVIGDTGHADGKYLYFAVFDVDAGSIINPLTLLPPVPDAQPPVVRRIMLVAGNARQDLDNGANVQSGKYDVLAVVYDLREDVRYHAEIAPYSVSLGLDGRETSRIVFDSLSIEEGRGIIGAVKLTRGDLYRPG
ncbi:MAG TPA: peptidoglycan DD-metalloendopeptidase family protein, partial [Spirochaetia bacterium]